MLTEHPVAMQRGVFIENSIRPRSAALCSDPPACHLPSAGAAAPQSNPPYQNPWAASVSESHQCSLREGFFDPALVGGKALPGAVRVCGVAATGAFGLPPDYADSCRPAGEYIGYTCNHLPIVPKNAEAIPASFAARMAFSNF